MKAYHKVKSLITPLEEYIEELLQNKNIYEVDIRGVKENIYLSGSKIADIQPPTLLTQIIAASKKQLGIPLPYRVDTGDSAIEIATDIARHHSEKKYKELQMRVEAKHHIAIALEENDAFVVSVKDPDNIQGTLTYVSEIKDEDISIFNGRLSLIDRTHRMPMIELAYQEKNSYIGSLQNIINNNYSLEFKTKRSDVALTLLSLITDIQRLHSQGLIHCDIKPQNILSLNSGLEIIGSLDTKLGKTSPGLTIEYAPPELILLKPVSPATDIYSLGLIILHLVNGVQYGRLSKYSIPIGRNQVKEVNLFESPDVYLTYENAAVPQDGMNEWRGFLLKCFEFNPQDRFQDLEDFKSNYEELLKKFPLQGTISFSPVFGDLRRLYYRDQYFFAWVIYDYGVPPIYGPPPLAHIQAEPD